MLQTLWFPDRGAIAIYIKNGNKKIVMRLGRASSDGSRHEIVVRFSPMHDDAVQKITPAAVVSIRNMLGRLTVEGTFSSVTEEGLEMPSETSLAFILRFKLNARLGFVQTAIEKCHKLGSRIWADPEEEKYLLESLRMFSHSRLEQVRFKTESSASPEGEWITYEEFVKRTMPLLQKDPSTLM